MEFCVVQPNQRLSAGFKLSIFSPTPKRYFGGANPIESTILPPDISDHPEEDIGHPIVIHGLPGADLLTMYFCHNLKLRSAYDGQQ